MDDEQDSQAIDEFNDAVRKARQAWLQADPDERWPGWVYMSPQMRAELGIPEPPGLTGPGPRYLDPSSPGFQPPWVLDPSMLSDEARARLRAQRAIAEAEAAATARLDADFADSELEAEP